MKRIYFFLAWLQPHFWYICNVHIHIFDTGLRVFMLYSGNDICIFCRLANTSRDHLFDRSACRCFGAYSIKMLVNIAHVLSYIPATHTHTEVWYVVRITLLCAINVCYYLCKMLKFAFLPLPPFFGAVAFTLPAVDFTLSPLCQSYSTSAWPHHQQQDLYPGPSCRSVVRNEA